MQRCYKKKNDLKHKGFFSFERKTPKQAAKVKNVPAPLACDAHCMKYAHLKPSQEGSFAM